MKQKYLCNVGGDRIENAIVITTKWDFSHVLI